MMGVARWDKYGMHFWTSLSEQHFTNRHVLNTFFLHYSSQIFTNQTVGYMLIAPLCFPSHCCFTNQTVEYVLIAPLFPFTLLS